MTEEDTTGIEATYTVDLTGSEICTILWDDLRVERETPGGNEIYITADGLTKDDLQSLMLAAAKKLNREIEMEKHEE